MGTHVRYDIFMTVIFYYLLRSFHDIASVDGVHSFRSRPGCEHGEYSGATADIKNDGLVEYGGRPEDERCVSRGADFVSEHGGVNICLLTVSDIKWEVIGRWHH